MNIGTVIHGTARHQDTIPAMLDTLREVSPVEYEQMTVNSPFGIIPSHAEEDDNAEWWDSEEPMHLYEELEDLLNESAPPYMYFGSHPGDGSDLGYWIDNDSLDMDMHDGELLQVADTSEVPEGYYGTVLHVNDHGNMTLYMNDGSGELTEIWAVV